VTSLSVIVGVGAPAPAAVVRPGRYVLGVGEHLDELTGQLVVGLGVG